MRLLLSHLYYVNIIMQKYKHLIITEKTQKTRESTLLTLSQSHILSKGAMTGIIAHPGKGKSRISHYLVSLLLKPSIFPNSKFTSCDHAFPILVIDTEQNNNDCINARNTIQNLIQYPNKDLNDKLIYLSLVSIDSYQKRQEILFDLYESQQYTTIIIDGILDFVSDPNHSEKSNIFANKLYAYCTKYNIATLYTFHANRNDYSGKAKGHLGDIIQRKSTSLLYLKKVKDKPLERRLTANFSNGKVRNGPDDVYTHFKWNSEVNIFTEINDCQITVIKDHFDTIFDSNQKLTRTELAKAYMTIAKVSESTAHRNITKALTNKRIGKENKQYSIL